MLGTGGDSKLLREGVGVSLDGLAAERRAPGAQGSLFRDQRGVKAGLTVVVAAQL